MAPRSTPRLAALAAVAFVSIAGTGAIAGCGPADPNLTSRTTFTIPSGDYAEAGDAICREVAQRFNEAQAESPRTFAQGAEVVGNLIDIANAGEQQLASLDPPSGQAQAFSLYLDARADVISQLERARDAIGSEDGDAYEQARRAADEGSSRRFKLAVRAGLDGCAKVERD